MAIERTGAAKEHWEQAKKHCDKALDLYPGDSCKDEYAKAIAEYSEVIKLLPNDARSYASRGSCYSILEQDEKALDDYDKAISLDPNDNYFYTYRFSIYVKLGEMEKAVADFEKALELAKDPEDKAYEYERFGSAIMKFTGNKREAAKYYRKAVELGDDSAKEQLAEWGM
jgi:tetratricopeptide (TPR) repeat protein